MLILAFIMLLLNNYKACLIKKKTKKLGIKKTLGRVVEPCTISRTKFNNSSLQVFLIKIINVYKIDKFILNISKNYQENWINVEKSAFGYSLFTNKLFRYSRRF